MSKIGEIVTETAETNTYMELVGKIEKAPEDEAKFLIGVLDFKVETDEDNGEGVKDSAEAFDKANEIFHGSETSPELKARMAEVIAILD